MLPQSVIDAFLALLAGQALWFAFRICDRLVFSPLSDVPGPFLAGLTYWYEYYHDVIRPGNFIDEIQKLHDRYGELLRRVFGASAWIGNNKSARANHPDFLDTLYPVTNVQKRDKDYNQVRHLGLPGSTYSTVDHDVHRSRKEALNPFFSLKNVMSHEPMINRKVDKFCASLDESVANRSPINLCDLYFALSYDIVYEYCFGQKSNLLDNPVVAGRRRKEFLKAQSSNARNDLRGLFSDESNGSTKSSPSVFEAIRSDSSLSGNPLISDSEKSDNRLEQEGASLLLAGVFPTAQNLLLTHRNIVASKPTFVQLLSELDTLPESSSLADLQRLDYLSASVAEGQRLSTLAADSVVPTRSTRVLRTPLTYSVPQTPNDPSPPSDSISPRPAPSSRTDPRPSIDRRKSQYPAPPPPPPATDYTLPAGTPISTHAHTTHTDESIFPCPTFYRPERWLGPRGYERRKYNLAFGKGARRCVGYNLATAVALKVISRVVRYDIRMAEGERVGEQLPMSRKGSGEVQMEIVGGGKVQMNESERVEVPIKKEAGRMGMTRRVSAVVIKTDGDGKEVAQLVM
ncbi:MAG: hypothetical protein M1828_006072 [Chrysothrix sp. TS-e1954]|nr:MAG: hypothetical protein M1828_006072 [Chrysothrix sp. TS-e1954]